MESRRSRLSFLKMRCVQLCGTTLAKREFRSEEEKVHIAQRYLIPRQIKENGITPEQIEFPEDAVRAVVRHYTREAGVRKLEQVISTICRKQARRVVEGHKEKLVVSRDTLKEFLGGIQVRIQTEVAERVKRPGVAVGLVW